MSDLYFNRITLVTIKRNGQHQGDWIEVFMVTQTRYVGGWDLSGSSEGGEKWSDLAWILKVESTGFTS